MPDAPGTPQGTPIPIPPDFPVTWDDPDDEHLHWRHEVTHAPYATLPLDRDFWQVVVKGMVRAGQDVESPTKAQMRFFNNYLYFAEKLVVPAEEKEAQEQRIEQLKRETVTRMARLWETEWLPEIKDHLAYWDTFDLDSASLTELVAHLDETRIRFDHLFHLHFVIVDLCYPAMSWFDELYKELFEDTGAFDAVALLQGLGNMTVEAGHALWDVSRVALAAADVRQALETLDPADVINRLENVAAAEDFLAQLRDYLETYGRRGVFWELTSTPLLEDPTPALRQVAEYIAQPDRDPRAELAAQAAERERAIAEARNRLQGYPQPVVDNFEHYLQMAQAGIIISEDHNYWIDFSSTYRVRRVLMACGRHLADAGVIDQPNDIVYLRWDEIRESLTALPAGDRHALVEARQAEMAHWRTITPPPSLGTLEEPPTPAGDDPTVLQGNPGSPGIVRGTARVLHSIADAGRLNEGDILVAPTTAPPWTALFATLAAIVTEAGGLLSHTAVVAREYGLPAVVGASQATTLIKDGQMIEVDGEAGIVRLL